MNGGCSCRLMILTLCFYTTTQREYRFGGERGSPALDVLAASGGNAAKPGAGPDPAREDAGDLPRWAHCAADSRCGVTRGAAAGRWARQPDRGIRGCGSWTGAQPPQLCWARRAARGR